MTFNEIETEFDKKFQFGVKYKEGSDTIVDFDYHAEELKQVKSFLKQSFIKYLQNQQEIVKDFAVGVSIDQRGRKWIDLEDLIKIYQAQIKELEEK